MSNGLHNILKAMRKNNVKPISVCMSGNNLMIYLLLVFRLDHYIHTK